MKRKRKVRVDYSLAALRRRAYLSQGGLCYWCKREMIWPPCHHGHSATADHLVPLHAGGKTRPGNIVAACRQCNCGRHSYLNRDKIIHDKRVLASSGDDAPSSPFEILLERSRCVRL